jgi:hypothetical protein
MPHRELGSQFKRKRTLWHSNAIHSNKKGATKVTPFFLYLAFPPSPRGFTPFTGPTSRSSTE